MIVYFGKENEPERWYVDYENGKREYISEEMWLMVVKAAHVPPDGQRRPIRISGERAMIEKFDCEAGEITQDTVPAEVIHL